jgi:hypothetical protein
MAVQHATREYIMPRLSCTSFIAGKRTVSFYAFIQPTISNSSLFKTTIMKLLFSDRVAAT